MGEIVVRSQARRVAGLIVIALALVGIGVMLGRGEFFAGLTGLLLTLAFGSWLVLVAPAVTVDETGVTLTSAVSRARVPFAAVLDVETGSAFAVRTTSGRFATSALPAVDAPAVGYPLDAMQQVGNASMGQVGVIGPNRAILEATTRVPVALAPDVEPGSLQALARSLIVARLGDHSAETDAVVVVRPHTWSLVVLGLLVVATVVGYLI